MEPAAQNEIFSVMLEAIFGSKQQTDTFLMLFPLDQLVTKNQKLNSGVYFYVVITIEKRRDSLASSLFDWENNIKVNTRWHLVFGF